MNVAGLVIFLSLIISIFGIPIIQDDSQTELVPEKAAEAYFHVANKSMTYCFDLSPIAKITDLLEVIRVSCFKYPLNVQSIHRQILNVDLWSNKEAEKPAQTDFFRTSSNLELTRIYVDKFINHIGTSKCKILPNISQSIYNFNNEMIMLTKQNFSHLHNLITREQFHRDVKQVILDRSNNSLTLPFDLNENFESILKGAEAKVRSYEGFLYLTFEIPAFSKPKRSIYKVHPKPIMFQNTPYILKPNYTVLINDANRSVLLHNDAMDQR